MSRQVRAPNVVATPYGLGTAIARRGDWYTVELPDGTHLRMHRDRYMAARNDGIVEFARATGLYVVEVSRPESPPVPIPGDRMSRSYALPTALHLVNCRPADSGRSYAGDVPTTMELPGSPRPMTPKIPARQPGPTAPDKNPPGPGKQGPPPAPPQRPGKQ